MYMSNYPNILFYTNSSKCPMCKDLLRLLQYEQLLEIFKLICIDDPRVRIPKGVDKVPTAIIPSMNLKLVGNEIFQWIQNLKRGRTDKLHNQSNGNIIQDTQNPISKMGPIGFVPQEMGGLSDNYAYTTVDAVPIHSYVRCSDMDKNTIYTGNAGKDSDDKLTEQAYSSAICTMKRQRGDQELQLKEIFDKQHKNIRMFADHCDETDKKIDEIVKKHQANIETYIGTK